MQEKKMFEFQLGDPSAGASTELGRMSSGQDRKLTVKVGGLAEQASGCCLIRYGDTSILCTSQLGKSNPGMGFFPLTCDYEERFYAAGKILGSRFIRREGRPSTEAVLTSRLIDRAVRPLFPKELTSEVQVIATCLSWDAENDPSTLGLLGASLALGMSEIPWNGPVAVVRIGYVENKFILNPTYEQRANGNLDLVLAGIEKEGELLINMIESGAQEVLEEEMLGAYDFAKPFLQEILKFQNNVLKEIAKPKAVVAQNELDHLIVEKIKNYLNDKLENALYETDKQKRSMALEALQEQMLLDLAGEIGESNQELAKIFFEEQIEKAFKENILQKDKRPDGRKLDEIRPLSCEIDILPRTHGSSIFTRGETKILSILTLGSHGDELMMDNMEVSGKKRFLHHYNFPPYSVGEVKRMGSPGRREIGHGMLAEKALLPLIPSSEDFPYTIRLVSEAISSNGSTSMASVCASTLSLMQAGVPIKRPVAGISVGLVMGKNLKEYKLLTDIQGPEDHYGEMDFKVAGTSNGITAIQMDVKTDGITREIFTEALNRAKTAREYILSKIKETIAEPNKSLSPYAPKVKIIQINPDKIGMVIGTGGKVINEIIDTCEVAIDIDDDGKVFITGQTEEAMEKAIAWIKEITHEFEIGETFTGKVKRIFNFGAMVEISPKQDGLVHISELAPFRVNSVEDVVKIGDVIPVKIIKIDEQGRVDLSAKQAGFSPENKSSTKDTKRR
ncbi:MAG: polyribonucleotide nucleotidyltransferase [Candidatus Pacebacteria bacterium]|nr:polyribonucleotide nucleotidyltransferase [Candidatus Paceibacterota bacterium]